MIVYRGYLGLSIDEIIARKQFDILAPRAVLYTASLIKLFVDEAVKQCIVRVPNDQPTIQGGIDAALPGCTILVSPGTYRESVTISKPLKLLVRVPDSRQLSLKGVRCAPPVLAFRMLQILKCGIF